MKIHNPLRDPVVVVKRDNRYALGDGFHRIHEARAREFSHRIWAIVLDMDAEDSFEEEEAHGR